MYAVTNSDRAVNDPVIAGTKRRYAPAPRKLGRSPAAALRPASSRRCSSSSSSLSAGGSAIAGSRCSAGSSSNSSSVDASPTRASIAARSASVLGM